MTPFETLFYGLTLWSIGFFSGYQANKPRRRQLDKILYELEIGRDAIAEELRALYNAQVPGSPQAFPALSLTPPHPVGLVNCGSSPILLSPAAPLDYPSASPPKESLSRLKEPERFGASPLPQLALVPKQSDLAEEK